MCRSVGRTEQLRLPALQVHRALRRSGLPFGAKAVEPKALEDYPFHHDAKNSKTFWDVRKGLIPIVGAAREVSAAAAACHCLAAATRSIQATSCEIWCSLLPGQGGSMHVWPHQAFQAIQSGLLVCCRLPLTPPPASLPPPQVGTSMLIEDVACPTDKLADMMIDLIDMFQRFGYNDASCFGHALEGNLHLVFAQVGAQRAWHAPRPPASTAAPALAVRSYTAGGTGAPTSLLVFTCACLPACWPPCQLETFSADLSSSPAHLPPSPPDRAFAPRRRCSASQT